MSTLDRFSTPRFSDTINGNRHLVAHFALPQRTSRTRVDSCLFTDNHRCRGECAVVWLLLCLYCPPKGDRTKGVAYELRAFYCKMPILFRTKDGQRQTVHPMSRKGQQGCKIRRTYGIFG